ncbi:hypothetical protein F5I97DRAFT_1851688 [Phlebopus sp. FC_14]|nr:hypothetical protein F5I97DRAFT_1851688 [Phlebopus sp. FC_14]
METNVRPLHSSDPHHTDIPGGHHPTLQRSTDVVPDSLSSSNRNARLSQSSFYEGSRMTTPQRMQQMMTQPLSSEATPTLYSRPSFQDGTSLISPPVTDFAELQPPFHTRYSFAGQSRVAPQPRFDTFSQYQRPLQNSFPIDPDRDLSFQTHTTWVPPMAHGPSANDRFSQLGNLIFDERYRRPVNHSRSTRGFRRSLSPSRTAVGHSIGISVRSISGIATLLESSSLNGGRGTLNHDTRVACTWNGGSCHTTLQPNRGEINAHLRADHACDVPGTQPVRCCWDNCSEVIQMQNLARHIISCHVQTKHQCSFCGRKLCRKDALGSHERKCRSRGQGVVHTASLLNE